MDDLVKGFLLGVQDASKWVTGLKFMQALVLGNYSAFQQDEQSFVINVFSSSPFFPTTPLLKLRILKLLIVRAGEDGGGVGSYLSVETVHHFFEAAGISLESIDSALSELLEFRLIEPYDASDDSVRAAQRVAVTLSGRMHFDMALSLLPRTQTYRRWAPQWGCLTKRPPGRDRNSFPGV